MQLTQFFFQAVAVFFSAKENISDNFSYEKPDFVGSSGEPLMLRIFNDAKSFGILLTIALGAAFIVVLAYSIVAKFKLCQKGQAEWMELVVLMLIEGLLMAVVAYLVSQSGLLLQGT